MAKEVVFYNSKIMHKCTINSTLNFNDSLLVPHTYFCTLPENPGGIKRPKK